MANQPEIPGIESDLQVFSWTELLSRTMDDPGFAAKMIAIFRTETVDQVAALRRGAVEGDRVDVRNWAHTLRGSAANMSGEALAHAAEALESAAHSASMLELGVLLDAIETQVARLFTAMENALAR